MAIKNINTDVNIIGNLTVEGTTTTINTTTVEVEDNIIQLNTTQADPDTATATTSGISIYRGDGVTQASLIFDDADDTWDLTNNLVVAGNIIKSGGTSSQFLKADGSVDSNPYLPLAGGTLTGNLTLSYAYPRINLYDTNNDSDYSIINNDGAFSVYDITNNVHRFSISNAGDISVSNNLAVAGNVTGANLNISNWNTAYDWGDHSDNLYLPIGGKAADSELLDGIDSTGFVRAYTTTNDNIDSDWGQSFKTFDPIPSGTPPIASPNIRTINVGENYARRTQIAFDYATDRAWFRRRLNSTWGGWVEFIHSGNIGSQSVSSADTWTTARTITIGIKPPTSIALPSAAALAPTSTSNSSIK
jgi:hypothetical protein